MPEIDVNLADPDLHSLGIPTIGASNVYTAKATRAEGFGGSVALPPETREQAKAFVDGKGQAPELTAELCFEGLDRGDFIIITDRDAGVFARKRIAEVEAALAIIEQRLPAAG